MLKDCHACSYIQNYMPATQACSSPTGLLRTLQMSHKQTEALHLHACFSMLLTEGHDIECPHPQRQLGPPQLIWDFVDELKQVGVCIAIIGQQALLGKGHQGFTSFARLQLSP